MYENLLRIGEEKGMAKTLCEDVRGNDASSFDLNFEPETDVFYPLAQYKEPFA